MSRESSKPPAQERKELLEELHFADEVDTAALIAALRAEVRRPCKAPTDSADPLLAARAHVELLEQRLLDVRELVDSYDDRSAARADTAEHLAKEVQYDMQLPLLETNPADEGTPRRVKRPIPTTVFGPMLNESLQQWQERRAVTQRRVRHELAAMVPQVHRISLRPTSGGGAEVTLFSSNTQVRYYTHVNGDGLHTVEGWPVLEPSELSLHRYLTLGDSKSAPLGTETDRGAARERVRRALAKFAQNPDRLPVVFSVADVKVGPAR